ncbi:hypothetical protein M879_21660 [Mycobacteroides abscessus V06705]|nr:hypothetical protein M879_21660 [Mycobacteroides abscessus V06705]
MCFGYGEMVVDEAVRGFTESSGSPVGIVTQEPVAGAVEMVHDACRPCSYAANAAVECPKQSMAT